MADDDVLTDDALGDQVALLQTPALANVAAGDIRPDPSIPQPKPAPVPIDPTRREKDERWDPKVISIRVTNREATAEGSADFAGNRDPLSRKAALRVARNDPGGFAVVFSFYIDAANMSRRPPFTPPQVGVAWRFMPDGGDWSDMSHRYDARPSYRGAGLPLGPHFDPTVSVPAATSGWLAYSGRIEDAAGSLEYDDVIRCLALD